jgi:putative salt-induced outer membrane protein
MLREAHAKERKAIVDVAKRLHPESNEAIDAFVRQLDREARTANATASLVEGWKGEVSVGGFLTSGNTDEWGVTGAVAIKRAGPRWTHEIEARADIKEEDHQRTEQRVAARYTLRRVLGPQRLFAFGRLSFEHDRFSGIDSRFFESVGIGYQLIATKSAKWDVMIGPAFRQSDYSDGSSAQEPALFARTRLEWEISDTLKFAEEADAGLAEGNSTLTSTTSLTSNLYGRLSGRISFRVEHETNPPAGRENTDSYARATLVYDF